MRFQETLLTASYERLPYPVKKDSDITLRLSRYFQGGDANPFLPWEGDAKRNIIVRRRDISTTIHIKGGEWVWFDILGEGKKYEPVASGIPFHIPRSEITYVWTNIPVDFVNYKALKDCWFRTNKFPLGDFEEETLLLMSWDDSERTVMGNLEEAVNLKLVFHHYPEGVSYFPRPSRQNIFHKIVKASDPTKGIYRAEDFDLIFWPKV
jgi:hypothetical protein